MGHHIGYVNPGRHNMVHADAPGVSGEGGANDLPRPDVGFPDLLGVADAPVRVEVSVPAFECHVGWRPITKSGGV